MPRSILAVTSELPWPLNTGGHLRTYELLREFATEYRVRLVTAVHPGQLGALDDLKHAGIEVRPAKVAARSRLRDIAGVVRARASGTPYVMYRRHDRAEVRNQLRLEIEHDRPDVVYLDHLDSYSFARLADGIPTVLDLHNIYSLLVERESASPGRLWPVRRYLKREAALLARVEANAARGVDALFSVSEAERSHFAALGAARTHLVPNGVACDKYADLPTGRSDAPPSMLFIGTLSWPPNVAAVEFLAKTVLPAVQRDVPETTLSIVGHRPSADVLALAALPHVVVHGSVADVRPHLAGARMLVVPLEAGGGTRLKILEAFAAGLPVVSTPVGCEGIDAADGVELLVASRDRFADAVRSLLLDRERGVQLAVKARALAKDRYDWRVVGAVARAALGDLVRRGGRA